MPYDAKAVANYFLDLAEAEGKRLSQMKLQKLVYYAHGWHLALTGKPLLNEQIQAWSFGPVVRTLYNEFKEFGAGLLTRRAQELVFDDGPEGDDELTETREPSLEDAKHESFLKPLLEKVWKEYGKYTASQLSNMTHAPGSAWYQLNEQHQGNIPRYATIPDQLIRDEFKQAIPSR